MDHSKFSDCWCPPFCLETAVTKITKPSHVENALYLDYLKSNPFVKNILGIRQPTTYFTIYIKPEFIKYFIYICLEI
jgi:hypothetical protein